MLTREQLEEWPREWSIEGKWLVIDGVPSVYKDDWPAMMVKMCEVLKNG